MAIFSIIMGILMFVLCIGAGVGGGYFLTLPYVLDATGMSTYGDILKIPNALTGYLILIGVGLLLGIITGLPLLMSGLAYKKACKAARRRRKKPRYEDE